MAQGDLDPDSPTARVVSYLASKGMQPTAQNVHNVLMAQASGMNIMPGLTTEAPPSADPGVGGKGNVAGKIEAAPGRSSTATPPNPPGDNKSSTDAGADAGKTSADAGKTSSTPPSDNIGGMIAAAVPLTAAGLWGASKFASPYDGGDSLFRPDPARNVTPMLDPAAGPGPILGQPGPESTIDYTQLPAEGNQYKVLPDNTATPFDRAMGRAVEPQSSPVPWLQRGSPDMAVIPGAVSSGPAPQAPAPEITFGSSQPGGSRAVVDPNSIAVRGNPVPASQTGTAALRRIPIRPRVP